MDFFQLFVHVGEPLEHGVVDAWGGIGLRPRARLDDVRERLHLEHVLGERVVDAVEHDALLRELLADILRSHEDVLEVHPRRLNLGDNLDNLGHQRELLLPRDDRLLKDDEVLGSLHRGQRDDVILERGEHVVGGAKLVNLLALAELNHVELEPHPRLADVAQGGLDRELLRGVRGHLPDELVVVGEAEVGHLAERKVGTVRVELATALLHELLPVPLPNRGIAQIRDEWHRLLEAVDDRLHGRPRHPVVHLAPDLLQLLTDPHGHVLHDLDVQIFEFAVFQSVVNADPFLANRP